MLSYFSFTSMECGILPSARTQTLIVVGVCVCVCEQAEYKGTDYNEHVHTTTIAVYFYCKVVLATLYIQSWHESKMADALQWTRLHPDYLRRIKVARCDAYLELCMRGIRVQGGLWASQNQLSHRASFKMASKRYYEVVQRIPLLCWSVTRFRSYRRAVKGRPHWLQPLTSPEWRLKSAFWYCRHAFCSSSSSSSSALPTLYGINKLLNFLRYHDPYTLGWCTYTFISCIKLPSASISCIAILYRLLEAAIFN